MIQDLIEIVVAYYQYLASILQTKGVGYTLPWVRTGESMSFVSLDEAFFSANVPDVTADARVFFIIVSIIIPLIMVFLGLLTLNPPSVVIWYFVLLASVFTLVAGVLAAIISQTAGLNISFLAAQVLMYVGAAGILACSVAFLCTRLSRDEAAEEMSGAVNEDALEARRLLNEKLALRRTREEREAKLSERRAETGMSAAVSISGPKQEAEDAEIEELRKKSASVINLSKKDIFRLQTQHFKLAGFLQAMLFGTFVLAFGVILIIGSEVVGIDAGSIGTFAFIIGVTLIAGAVVLIAWTLPAATRKGREFKWHASHFLQMNGMRLLILLMMILYIPIGSSSIVIFNCNTYSCPQGYRLVDQGTAVLYNWTTREGRANGANPYCYPCNPVANPRAPLQVYASACNFNEDSRLESSPEIRCASMQRFFWPAAALAFVYILGVPILYLRLIAHSTAVLKDDFPVDPKLDDWEQIWEAKIGESANVVKFLYQPFEYKFRYWRLAQLMQKLGVVITGTYVFRTGSADFTSSTISLGCALVIHISMSVALFITEPFIRLYDDGVATALHACLVSCCIIALCILYGQVPPDEFNIFILAVFLLVPLVLFGVGVHLELRWAREQDEEAEAEQRKRVVEHLEKMDSAQMRAAVESRRQKLNAARHAPKDANGNPLAGATKPAGSDSDGEGDTPMVAVAGAVSEQQETAARPMTALNNDDGDGDGMSKSGYGAVRNISTARTMARQLGQGHAAGAGQGHAAPSFLAATGSRGGRGGMAPRSPNNSRGDPLTASMSRSGLVAPGAATESTAAVENGTAELASPRMGSKRFSMRQTTAQGGKRVSTGGSSGAGGSSTSEPSPNLSQYNGKRPSGQGLPAPPPIPPAALELSASMSFRNGPASPSAGSPSAAGSPGAGSPSGVMPVDLSGSLRRKPTAVGLGGTMRGSMRVGRKKSENDADDPFMAALAASRLSASLKAKKEQERRDSSTLQRRDSDTLQRRDSSTAADAAARRQSSSTELGGTLRKKQNSVVFTGADEDAFGASASVTDAELKRQLEHSSDSDDELNIDDEEAAKLAEKRAEIMARVLKAEASRKTRRDMVRAGTITEAEGELARMTRIAAMIGRSGGGDALDLSSSMQESDLLGELMKTGRMDDAALAQARLDGADFADEDGAVELELAEQALEMVEEQIFEETRDLRETQGDIDLAMNISAERTINRYLMAAGFIGFSALGCSLLGMLASSDDAVVSTRGPATIDAQIGGYLTWEFFVDACVCMPVRNDVSRLSLAQHDGLTTVDVEVWVCGNGETVERVRSVVNGTGVTSGTPTRPICGNYFGLGCTLTTRRDETLDLACPLNTTSVIPKTVLDLW